MTAEEPAASSIRRELLVGASTLFVAAVVVAVAAAGIILPLAGSPASALVALTLILLAELGILWLFLHSLLKGIVLEPVGRIVAHAERIAGGEPEHRIPPEGLEELDRVVGSVNTLAERLIAEQEALARNVASLDRTNRELSEMSRELVRSARLASVGTLAAGVAHEIGNPLGALRGYLDVLRARLREGRAPGDLLDAVDEEVLRIDSIVRYILDFGRPGAAGAELPLVDPLAVAERVIGGMEARGELSRGTATLRVEPGLPRVRARPEHLERVLGNLLANARQAGEETGRPAITVRLQSAPGRRTPPPARRGGDAARVDYAHRRRLGELLGEEPPPPADAGERDLVITVEDRGGGIPEAVLDRLFDPFFMTREPGAGTGMGLALAQRIMNELGGGLDAANRAGGGACFTIRLPGVEAKP